MADIVSFGEWVQTRRNYLRYNRSQFANLVGCAPVTIKKIERDERRPSLEIAQLLAVHLQIPEEEQEDFLRRARGEFVPRLGMPTEMSLAEAQAPPDVEESPKHNLPQPTTPFFGRKRELAEIAERLADPNCRLLTILAVGGMGKTRLGIEAAAGQVEHYTDGVTFVPLAPVNAPTGDEPIDPLVTALSGALRLSFHGRETPEQQLFTHLQRKEMLLLIDNFEHLLASAPFLGDLLSHAPDVKMLITSRERLNLQEEWLLGLQGLSFPVDVSSAPLPTGFGAVSLFAQRASQVRPSFVLEDEYAAVLRICRLVEGMPLGLELAAAWVAQLSCEEIADEIDMEIGFLSTEMRNVPERHRNIRYVFDYSWEKLNDKERDALQKLSVFRGGFDRMAAKAVAGASLKRVASLVGKSLLSVADDGRYTVHELLRQFAAEKLAVSPSLEQETKLQHALYYLTFLREQDPRTKGPEAPDAMMAMAREYDNLRVAIRRAVRLNPVLFDREVAESLLWLFTRKGWFLEGETSFGLIVDRLKPDCMQELAAENQRSKKCCLRLAFYLHGLGSCQTYVGRLQAGEETIRLALSVIPPTKNATAAAAKAVNTRALSSISFYKGEYNEALNLALKTVKFYKKAKDIGALADNYLFLLNIYLLIGNFSKAEECLATAEQLSLDVGEQYIARRLWNEMGKLAMIRGQLDEAEEYFRVSLAQLEEMDLRTNIAFVWRERGDTARLKGNFDLARFYCRRGIAVATDLSLSYAAAQGLWSLGNLAVDEGKFENALRYFDDYKHSSKIIQEHIGGPGWALQGLGRNEEAKSSFAAGLQVMLSNETRPIGLDALVGMAQLMAADGQVEEALALLALVRAHPSSYWESKEKARRVWEELAAELPAEMVGQVELRGQGLDLRKTAESLLAESSF